MYVLSVISSLLCTLTFNGFLNEYQPVESRRENNKIKGKKKQAKSETFFQ